MTKYSAVALIALLPLAYLLPAQQDPVKQKEVAPTVIEDETDIPFPIWMDMFAKDKDKKERHYLLGTGVREKYFIGVDVYGFAWYVEKKAAAPLLKKSYNKGVSMKKLLKDKRFHTAMMSDSYNKSMRWVMARDVDGEDVAEAFDEFLEPGIRQNAANDKELRAGLKAMAEMRAYFASGELEEEDELIFLWETGGNMHTYLNGRKLGKITNVHLCYALFDVFVGFDPVDEDGREAIYEGAVEMVKKTK
jgi:hypothetical protein